jgi:alpha-L-rhamnosidase
MRPTPLGGLQFVRARYRSPHGLIESEWRIASGRFDWDIRVPVNATATVHIPAKNVNDITESGMPIRNAEGVTCLRTEGPSVVLDVQSGAYRFSSLTPV